MSHEEQSHYASGGPAGQPSGRLLESELEEVTDMASRERAAFSPPQANSIPPGYMADAKGRLVPVDQVKSQHKLEDQLVAKILGYAEDLSAQIARFKGHCFDDVGAFLQLLGERYGATRGGRKGNMMFTSYDGLTRVTVQVADHLSFGPELQVAKELIDGCIAEWSEGARGEIRALVNHAFAVDKQGQVSRDAIFALRRVQIDDARWQRAMDAIADSIRVTGSKTYIRFHRRPDPTAKWQAVSIDLASV